MTTPQERWDGPIQDAIRRHDQQQGNARFDQFGRPIGQPVSAVDWFRRSPGGGTVFALPVDQQPEGPGAQRLIQEVDLPEEES